jgi:hypothetical protein
MTGLSSTLLKSNCNSKKFGSEIMQFKDAINLRFLFPEALLATSVFHPQWLTYEGLLGFERGLAWARLIQGLAKIRTLFFEGTKYWVVLIDEASKSVWGSQLFCSLLLHYRSLLLGILQYRLTLLNASSSRSSLITKWLPVNPRKVSLRHQQVVRKFALYWFLGRWLIWYCQSNSK